MRTNNIHKIHKALKRGRIQVNEVPRLLKWIDKLAAKPHRDPRPLKLQRKLGLLPPV